MGATPSNVTNVTGCEDGPRWEAEGAAGIMKVDTYSYMRMEYAVAPDTDLAREVTRLHADFCLALTDSRRLLIIYSLAEGPKNVTELTRELSLNQPSVSRHLKVLRDRGLVRYTRDGVNIEYELVDDRLIEALDILRAMMRDLWAERAELMGQLID